MGGGCPEKGDDKQAEESGVLTAVLPLVRPGAVIVADNIVRDGAVVDPDSTDARVRGVRRFLEMVRDDPRLDATAVQTVGTKGWDGFALVLVR
jgi:predicted O-methyltransferase YrrM